MQITKALLIGHVSTNVLTWFDKTYPSGSTTYESLLERLMNDGFIEVARNLLRASHGSRYPKRKIVLTGTYSQEHLVAAGDLEIEGNIHVPGLILVGGNLRVWGNVSCRMLRSYANATMYSLESSSHVVVSGALKTTAGGIACGGMIRARDDVSSQSDIMVFSSITARGSLRCERGSVTGSAINVGANVEIPTGSLHSLTLITNGSLSVGDTVSTKGDLTILGQANAKHFAVGGLFTHGDCIIQPSTMTDSLDLTATVMEGFQHTSVS